MRPFAAFVTVVLLATTSIASSDSAKTSLAEKLKQRVATLTLQLESSDVAEQLKAVEDLAELGPLGVDAVPELIRLTQSNDLALQHETVIALGRIGPAAASVVPALTATLDSKSTIVRHSAMHSLRLIGLASKSAVPRLSQLAREKDPLLSVAAAWALVEIDPENDRLVKLALPVLVAALNNPSEDVRSDAVAALGDVGAAAVSAVAARDLATPTPTSACAPATHWRQLAHRPSRPPPNSSPASVIAIPRSAGMRPVHWAQSAAMQARPCRFWRSC